jgi:hypothetical protein
MKVAIIALQWLIRLLAVVQLTLGGLFWTGNAFAFIPLHMLSGLLLVIGLWAQAGIKLRAGVHFALPALAAGWGVLVIALGMRQFSILPGDLHWIIQVVHLVVGLGAIAQAENLARRALARTARSRESIGARQILRTETMGVG